MTRVIGNSSTCRRHVALVHAGVNRSEDEDRFALDTIRALQMAGHRVTAVLPGKSPFRKIAKQNGIATALLPLEPANRSLPWDSVARIGAACGLLWSRNIKIVHCTNPLPVATLLPAARMLKIPVISQVLAVTSDEELDHTLCRHADVLMPSSRTVEQSLAAYLGRKKTHSVRHMHVAAPGFSIPDGWSAARGLALRVREGVTKDEMVVAMVGELHPGRGCDLLLEAIQLVGRRGLHPRVWIAAGETGFDQSSSSYRMLVSLARDLGIDNHVSFLGEAEERAAIYQAADIVVAPSRIDSLGLAAREAMFSGTAVIASNTGGLADAVDHNRTGLIAPPVGPQALADAIFRLLVDYDLRTKLSAEGRKFAKLHFTHGRFVEQLLLGHEIAAGNMPAVSPSCTHGTTRPAKSETTRRPRSATIT